MPVIQSQIDRPRPKVFIGIDPGMTGAIVRLYDTTCKIRPMPETDHDIWNTIAAWLEWSKQGSGGIIAMIEQVGGFMGTRAGEPKKNLAAAHQMFKFGRNYGAMKMALTAAGIPYEEVIPQTWQKAMGVTSRGKNESKDAFKNRLKARAQCLFPREKIVLAVADGVLIAEYCRRKHEGTL